MRANCIITRLGLAAMLLISSSIITIRSAAAGDDVGNVEPRLPNPQWRASPPLGSPKPTRPAPTSSAPLVEPHSDSPKRPPVAPPELSDKPASFEERCAQSGVILCDPLDDGRVRGAGITSATPNATLRAALNGRYRDWRWCNHVLGVSPGTPAFDNEIKTSGSGALRFTVPAKSAAGDAGYCQINFTPDNSVQFGEGETFFVQFRVRLSCTLLFKDCDPASVGYKKQRRVFGSKGKGGTTFKVSIINAGDDSSLQFPVSSCTAQHLVLVQGRNGIVAGYHSCGWYDGHALPAGKENGSRLWDRQPKKVGSGRPCVNRSEDDALLNCVLWPADEWVTITQQVTVGQWVAKLGDPSRDSNVRIWMQRKGEAPVLVIDYNRNLRSPEKPTMKYGKIWLLPYMTDKDPLEDNPEAYMWFDELIVSRAPIAPTLD